ncbi:MULTISPECIES: ComEC/Rec2 family competence protein [Campylobacter]|uniref:ComEC/Rec2 family competence protein n=1 Tax=Campylobacter TaxID=194 RepID=UPI000A33CB52|nr:MULTISPECIES: ComEC/Rec2 family competence protein [unclassified Campylobacter]MCR8678329.1 ComEC/Rec2 family competence protein [Campylobacter sp. RM19072]MCR8695680.1 ComEC/Rec2 family competence protein [Campylobacter sp. RM19073]
MNLFANFRQFSLFVAICMVIFALNFYLEFRNYEKFRSSPYSFIKASLLFSDKRQGKSGDYYILQFKSDKFIFYTRSKDLPKCSSCEVGVITKNLKFKDYITSRFFLPSFKISDFDEPKSLTNRLKESIINQHTSTKIQELYSALYLATPMSKELRQNVTNWGIAHIIAISGFHLSVIFIFIFFISNFTIKPLQDRYFPYINLRFYISLILFILMGFYLYILDFTPSFLRSYIMGVVGFLLLSRGLKVFSFGNLILSILIGLAFSVELLFSIGFYFSCFGVYFIFLYIYHFGNKEDLSSYKRIFIHTLALEIFVFLAMNIPVYYFFPTVSWYQLSVIPLAYVFIIFYPLSLFLHLIGCGGIFDEWVLKFIEFAPSQGRANVDLWQFIAYNILALLAIYKKQIMILLALLGLFVYIFALI